MRLAFQLASRNLRGHRGRSVLSSLGIFICVFFVVAIMVLSGSVTKYLSLRLTSGGSHWTIISGASDNSLLDFLRQPLASLTSADLADASNIAGKDNVIANRFMTATATSDGTDIQATIIGTTSINEQDFSLSLAGGSWMNDSHSDNKPLVVLGYDIAQSLIGTDVPQNETVTIGGRRYTIVGVLKKSPQPLSLMGVNLNHSIFMSDANSAKLSGNKDYSQILIRGLSMAQRENIRQRLAQNHDSASDYSLVTADKLEQRVRDLSRYIILIASGVIIIILLISVVSIASVMMVSITERKREIGIRKAVGATPHNIVQQYLAEALIITVRAGLAGFALAYIVAGGIALIYHLPLVFSWWTLLVGVVGPVIIGLIAGIYPAVKASRQNIIEALNQLT